MPSVDERIVSMKFNNKQFEEGVKQSLNSIENLKEGLDFSGALEGLRNLGKASSSTTFESLANSVDNVSSRFTNLGIVAQTCLQRITNAAIDTGIKMVKYLSTDQIVSGMSKYEEKTKAMQTIMAATGLTIEEVNEQVSKLNWYTDETSYNFTDMVSNVGKFTAQGVELEDAVQAMEGIANWAAVSGQGISEASRAMYNLSQALGLGSVRVQDWMSIENANMATVEFKETVIETAKAMGTLTDDMGVTVENFRTTLSEGWFNNDVLIAVLNKYGQYSEQVHQLVEETGMTAAQAMDYMTEHAEELGIEIGTLGEKSFKAAQEAKTFTEAIDAAKDAVSTGWMTTFELLFGNYEEAKELWTDLANALYGIFAEGINEQNELLEIWKEMGGRTVLIEALVGAFRDLLLIIAPIKRAMATIFPTTAEGLYNLTVKFRDLVNNLWMSQQTFDSLVKVFEGLFSVLKLVGMAASGIYNAFKPVLTLIRNIAAVVIYAAGCLGEFVAAFVEILDQSGVFDELAAIIQNALITLGDIILNIVSYLIDFIAEVSELPIVATIFNSIKSAGNSLYNTLYPILVKLIETIVSLITTVTNALSGIDISSPIDVVNVALTLLHTLISSVTSAIGDLFGLLSSNADGILSGIANGALTLANGFGTVVKIIQTFIDLKAEVVLETLSDALVKTKNALTPFAETIRDLPYEQLFAFAAAILYLFTAWQIALLIGSISSFFTSASQAIIKVSESTASVLTSVSKVINNTSNVIGSFEKKVDRSFWTSTIMQIAVGIGIIAASLIALSYVDTGKLTEVAKTLGVLAVGFVALSVVSSIVNGILGKALGATKVAGLASSMIALGVACVLLATALTTLVNTGKSFQRMQAGIEALGLVLAEFVVAVGLLGLISPVLSGGVLTILAVAASVKLLVSALLDLSTVDTNTLYALTLRLQTITEILVMLIQVSRFGSLSGALGSIAMIGAIVILVKALDYLNTEIANVNFDILLANIDKLKLVAVGLLAFAVMSRISGNGSLSTGLGLIGAATAMVIFVKSFDAIKGLNQSELDNIAIIVTLCGEIAVALVGISTLSKNMMKVGASFILMAAAFGIIVGIVSIMKNIDEETLQKGTSLLSTVGVIAAALVAVTALTEKAKVAPIIAMIAMLGVLFASLSILTLFDTESLIGAGITMCVGLLGIASVLTALSKFGNNGVIKTIGTILVIITMVGAIAGSIYLLQGISWESAIATAGSMALAFVALSLALNSLNNVKINASTIAAILACTLSMMGIAYSLNMIAMYDWTSLIAAAGSLAIAILAVSAAALISGDSATGAVALVAMGLAVIEFAAALSILANVDCGTLASNLIALGVALAVIVGVSAIVAVLPQLGAAMTTVAAALVTFGIAAIAFSAAATLFAIAMNLIANALVTLGTIGPEAAANIGNAIQTILVSIAAGFVQSASIVLSAVYDLGTQIIEGIKNGITDAISGLWDKAQEVGSWVINGLKDILKIHSPSEEGKDIGEAVGAGLEQGLENSESDVYNAAADLGSSAVNGIESATTDAAVAGSDVAIGAAEGVGSQTSVLNSLGGLLGISTGDGLSGALGYVKENGLSLITNTVDALKDPSVDLFSALGIQSGSAYAKSAANTMTDWVDQLFNFGSEDGEEGIFSGFKESISSSIPSVEDFSTSLGSAGSSAGSAASSTADLTDEIKTNTKYTKYITLSVTAYASKLKSLSNNTLDDTSATSMATTAINCYAEALYDAQRAADGLSDVEEDAATRTKNVKEIFIEAYESFQSAISGAMDLYSTFEFSLEASSSDMLTAIKSNITGMKGAISSIGTLISKGFDTDLIYELMQDIPSNLSEIQALISMNTEEIADYNEQYKEYIALQSDGAAELIAYAAACKTGGKSFEEFKAQILASGNATEELITIVDSLEDSFNGITDTTYGVVKSAEEITAAYQSAKEALTELLETQVDYFEEFETDDDVTYDTMLDNIKSQYEGISKWTTMFDSICGRAGEDGQEFMQTLYDMGLESYDYLQALNYSTDEEIQKIIEYFNKINDYMPQAAETATNAMQTCYNAFGITDETYYALEQEANNTGNAIAEGVATGVLNGTNTVQAAVTNMTTAVTDTANTNLGIASPSKVAEEIGQYFIEGLIEGVENETCRDRLIRAIKSLADDMIETLEKSLEVASPSERTAEIGEFLDLGIIQGLTSLSDKVSSAAKNVAEGTINTISSGLTSISSLLSEDLDNVITITPVLDLTNVQSGMGTLNSMLAADSTYGLTMQGINLEREHASYMTQDTLSTKTDNSDVVNAVNSLKTEMAGIKTGLNNMKIVLDTGVMAGAVAQGVSARIQNGVKKKEVVWA